MGNHPRHGLARIAKASYTHSQYQSVECPPDVAKLAFSLPRRRGEVRQKAKVPHRVRLLFAFSLLPFAFTQPLTPALTPHPMKGEGVEAAPRLSTGSHPESGMSCGRTLQLNRRRSPSPRTRSRWERGRRLPHPAVPHAATLRSLADWLLLPAGEGWGEGESARSTAVRRFPLAIIRRLNSAAT